MKGNNTDEIAAYIEKVTEELKAKYDVHALKKMRKI